MNPEEVFATSGLTGLTGVVLFMVYRFCFSKHRVKSNCCGKEMSIETSGSEPHTPALTENPLKVVVKD